MTRLYHAFGFLIGAIASMAENADTCMTHEALVKARNLTRPDDPATVAKRAKAKAKKLEASVASASTPGAFAGAPTPGASAPIPMSEIASAVRERCNDRSGDHRALSECPRGRHDRDPLDAVLDGHIAAIRARSGSPAAHRAQAWAEYWPRKQAQLAQQAAEAGITK